MRFWTLIRSTIVLFVATEVAGAMNGVDESKTENMYTLGRDRLPPSNSPFQRALGSNTDMKDIWGKAARAARSEIEALRLLHSEDMMSMSLSTSNDRPPRPPIVAPTQKPLPTPTLAPTLVVPTLTSAPTSIEQTMPDQQPAQVPTNAECVGKPRADYIFEQISSTTKQELLLDPTTPQGKAYTYLVNSDGGISDHCTYTTIEQRYGLTTFFFATGGDLWSEKSGWLGIGPECSWSGVHCDDDSKNVTRLLLQENNLVGSLPEEIKTLTKLQRLDVFNNSVIGTIPSTLSALKDLVLLDLEENQMSGLAFPSSIFGLESLVSYRISNNRFLGSIPTDFVRLSKLCQLWAAGNLLTGTIPTEITSSGKLETLLLYENKLEGSLPKELGMLGNLYDLQLYNNTLQTKIPSELFSATKLKTLRLDYNFLTGTLPTEVGKLTELKDLRLDKNSLYGSIPSEIGSLTNLRTFVINNNFWTGTFPDVFQNYASLDFFDVSNANFNGVIPKSLFDVPTIRIVYLSNNTFTGTIPKDFSAATILRDLFLDGNSLTGTVPEISTGQLQSLTELLVQFNYLTGTMPKSICDLRQGGKLNVLFSDCGGSQPEIECEFPECCNRCFEGGDSAAATSRRKLSSASMLRRSR